MQISVLIIHNRIISREVAFSGLRAFQWIHVDLGSSLALRSVGDGLTYRFTVRCVSLDKIEGHLYSYRPD